MKLALALKRSDLFIPSFFTGIFSEIDYENAQRIATSRSTPVSLYTHKPSLIAGSNTSNYLRLTPYTIVAARKDGELLIYTYQRSDDHPVKELRGKWSIGIDSHCATMPNCSMGLLDILSHAARKTVFLQTGIDIDIDTAHRCLSYSSFVLDKSNDYTSSSLAMAHRVNFSSIPRTFPWGDSYVQNAEWLNSDRLQQMREDGLMEVWSDLLLEEEFV